MFHWVPYREPDLLVELGVSRGVALSWLRDDRHHTLAQLAVARGLDLPALAARLVDPWAARLTAARRRELRVRAMRTLTQGHLAQHLFFHSFHSPAIALRADALFGVSPTGFQDLRLRGRSPASIAASRGRGREELADRTARVLRDVAAEGVQAGATPSDEAGRVILRQLRGLDHWLDSTISKPGHAVRAGPAPVIRSQARLRCRLFTGRHHSDRRVGSVGSATHPGSSSLVTAISAPWPVVSPFSRAMRAGT